MQVLGAVELRAPTTSMWLRLHDHRSRVRHGHREDRNDFGVDANSRRYDGETGTTVERDVHAVYRVVTTGQRFPQAAAVYLTTRSTLCIERQEYAAAMQAAVAAMRALARYRAALRGLGYAESWQQHAFYSMCTP